MFCGTEFLTENQGSSLQAPSLSFAKRFIIKGKLGKLQRQHGKKTWTQPTPDGQRMGPFAFQKLWFHSSAARSELNRKNLILSFPSSSSTNLRGTFH